MPSVRRLAQQRGVSITTAVASLRVLEQRGLIVARPKSGYFVASRRSQAPEPVAVDLPRTARLVGAQAMLKRLAEASLNPVVARLGQAIPDPALFPRGRIARGAGAGTCNASPGCWATIRCGWAAARRCAARSARITRASARRSIHRTSSITNGCMEALALAVRAVAKPGDTIAVESPTYFGFLQIAENLGVKVLEVPMHPRDGLSIESLRDLLGGRSGSVDPRLHGDAEFQQSHRRFHSRRRASRNWCSCAARPTSR